VTGIVDCRMLYLAVRKHGDIIYQTQSGVCLLHDKVIERVSAFTIVPILRMY
jgi:hypothetical protein